MSSHLRKNSSAAILICAALALALLLPFSASASAAGASASGSKQAIRAERKADRIARHEARELQRTQRHDAKKAANEATRSERQAEREARRAARQAERTERSDASTTEPGSGETAPGETAPGENSQQAPTEGSQEVPAGSGAQPALTPRSGCSLTVAASAAQVVVGETVTLSGKLSCPAGLDVAGREVTIEQRQAAAPGQAGASSTSLAPAGAATTAEDGSYEFHSAALTGRSTFVVRSAGVRQRALVIVRVGAGLTLESTVASGAALTLSTGKAAGGPTRLSFSGVVQPAAADIGVGLRVRYAGAAWRTVAFARTDADGHYSFSHRFRVSGAVEVATVAHPHGEQRTESTPLSYTIAPASTSTPMPAQTPATPTPTSQEGSPTPAT
ncbi:MAG TPA: hypothetical protein VH081_07455 [Solirubrobacteraceae bacterium]|nr:hypothetical protein [Solirubrobacteraceae bacterium]